MPSTRRQRPLWTWRGGVNHWARIEFWITCQKSIVPKHVAHSSFTNQFVGRRVVYRTTYLYRVGSILRSGTRRFTRACHLSQSLVRSAKSTRILFFKKSVLILSFYLRLGLYLRYPHQNLACTAPLPTMCQIPPSHLILDLTTWKIFDQDGRSRRIRCGWM